MVNAINDKKLFNSMETNRKMKYQSLGFPKSSSQRRTVSSWFQASNYFALRQTNISHRFEELFHCKKQIFFSKQKPCNYREAGWLFQGHWNQLTRSDDHFQSSSLISKSLGPSGVRIWYGFEINKQMVIVSKVF